MKKIIAGTSSPMLSKSLMEITGIPIADVSIKKFPDGECYVRINEEIEHAIIIENTYPDEKIIELFLLQDAARRMAGKIDVVIPYYGYGRQDKIFEGGEAISAEKMAKLIEQDAERIVLVNPHKKHISRFFSIPVDIIDATPILAPCAFICFIASLIVPPVEIISSMMRTFLPFNSILFGFMITSFPLILVFSR